MTTPKTIRSLAVFDLLAGTITEALPVRVELRYDIHDPFAVHLTFQTGLVDVEDVVWTFGRDLIAEGLMTDAGYGDVRIRPSDPDTIEIELSSPSGHAVFATSAADLDDFLRRTFEVCPPGTEYSWLDVDFALTSLIERETA